MDPSFGVIGPYQNSSCKNTRSETNIDFMIWRAARVSMLMLVAVTVMISGCLISGCSFSWDENNVGSVVEPSATPASTPQIPESMKTGSVTGEPEPQQRF